MDFTEEYRKVEPHYRAFSKRLHSLLTELLYENNIKYSTIEYRTKTVESFSEKITRDGKSYIDPINEITDLSGLRIILYYLDDLPKVRTLIENEFNVDEKNSKDNKDILDFDQFGYLSIHEIVSLKEPRASLVEWKRLINLSAEIQIRTVLQHAWASTSHSLQYKNENDIPRELRRQLHRLAGLFELADQEFLRIKDSKEKIISSINTSLEENNYSSISINMDSLRRYVISSKVVREIVSVAEANRFLVTSDNNKKPRPRSAKYNNKSLSQLVNICNMLKISTIEKLDDILNGLLEKSSAYFDYFTSNQPEGDVTIMGSFEHIITVLLLIFYRDDFSIDELNKIVDWGEEYTNTIMNVEVD